MKIEFQVLDLLQQIAIGNCSLNDVITSSNFRSNMPRYFKNVVVIRNCIKDVIKNRVIRLCKTPHSVQCKMRNILIENGTELLENAASITKQYLTYASCNLKNIFAPYKQSSHMTSTFPDISSKHQLPNVSKEFKRNY